LWQFYLVEDYEGGAAIVSRIHHAIADGISLIGVMLSMTDDVGPMDPPPAPHDDDTGFRAAVEPLIEVIEQGLKASDCLFDMVKNPVRLLELVRQGTEVAAELTWLLTMPVDSDTRLKGKLSGEKRVASGEPLSLRDVKAIAHALGCTVNDVLLASVTSALRAYLASKGDETEGVELRALVPVNLRPAAGMSGTLGNHFGVFGLSLPVGEADPLERVQEGRAIHHDQYAAGQHCNDRTNQAVRRFAETDAGGGSGPGGGRAYSAARSDCDATGPVRQECGCRAAAAWARHYEYGVSHVSGFGRTGCIYEERTYFFKKISKKLLFRFACPPTHPGATDKE
jgi:WS/DGAT/MGAT family acyltransferase